MNEPMQINDTNIKTNSKIVWMGIQASAPMLLIVVVGMDKLSLLEPILPDLRNVFLIICGLSIAAPFLFLGHFKRIQNKIRDNLQLGIENESTELQRYFTFLVIGMCLCDLSAMFGMMLYITVGDYFFSLIFIAVSFFLGFLYKPELT